MENLSNFFTGATRVTGPLDHQLPFADEARLARSIYRELQLPAMPLVNLLLIGSEAVMQHILKLLLPVLDKPFATWRPGELLVPPSVAHAGTMILDGVAALGTEDQHRLLEWSNQAAGKIRIVSTSAAPLFPLVQAGTFLDTLYYRLNVICVDATDDSQSLRAPDVEPVRET
jgi:transcriptional regulator of acetoin/glycerol metabolism